MANNRVSRRSWRKRRKSPPSFKPRGCVANEGNSPKIVPIPVKEFGGVIIRSIATGVTFDMKGESLERNEKLHDVVRTEGRDDHGQS